MPARIAISQRECLRLAARHGLQLKEILRFDDIGIDFKVAFARDLQGQEWVLRIPRREGLGRQILHEKRILDLVKSHLSISVPDWQFVDSTFIAYPLLEDSPAISLDPTTHEIEWNIDKDGGHIHASLARTLVELHRIPPSDSAEASIKSWTIDQVRQELIDEIDSVKREMGLRAELEKRWRSWIETDSYWPDFTCFIHGDLYAGHILADRSGTATGIIDWSEAQVSDPSIDLSGHLALFGEPGLRELVSEYEAAGGRTWEAIIEHTRERCSISPLKYAVFALRNGLDQHINAARAQLAAL